MSLLELSLTERYSEIKRHQLCSNCLRHGHFKRDCKAGSCKHCNVKHNSLLHPVTENSAASSHSQNNSLNTNEEAGNLQFAADGLTTPMIAAHSAKGSRQVLLATAEVSIADDKGRLIHCRALLDGGSMSNFITNSLAEKLQLQVYNANIPIAGVNNTMSNISKKTEAKIYSRDQGYKGKESFLIVNKITCDMPQATFDSSRIKIPNNIKLADERFNERPVDILLGAGVFFDVLCIGQIKTGNNNPILQKTNFGWLISGHLQLSQNANTLLCNLSVSNEMLHNQVESFWKLEHCSVLNNKFTREESDCESHFLNNYQRDDEGRFTVSLPFKNNVTELGDSEHIAIKRFNNLENKLQKNNTLREQYIEVMREYENLGHMTRLDLNSNTRKGPNYYMPHHGVHKESSETTKLRVVFDASAQSTSGLSLNNVLKVGPLLQQDLFSIVLKFRKHNVVMTADIEKMYRQIQINEADRDYQRIVWRENVDSELQHFQLNTISFGTASASFLAVRVLMQAAVDYEAKFPQASQIIKRDFYMDDLITGADSIENAVRLKNQITEILDKACLPLRKWCSNKTEVLTGSNINNTNKYIISDDKLIKTLGLQWEPIADSLSYSVDTSTSDAITKRIILSTISKIFDPLGLIAPITIRAKLIMQALWQSRTDWDESITNNLYTAWQQFREQLPFINDLKIQRQVTGPSFLEAQLHGFCDASERAFGACIYLRTTDKDGNHFLNLLCAKSRVAPLKTTSIPRLELCGAVLLTQLMKKVEYALEFSLTRRYIWCDSTITLAWIAAEPITWKTFVANRVSEIQENSSINEWKHIRSGLNPADILSRGASPPQLIDSELWWHGPDFLTSDSDSWPIQNAPLTN